MLNLIEQLLVVITVERVLAGAHVVQSDPAGPVVSLSAVVLLTLTGFWGEEER